MINPESGTVGRLVLLAEKHHIAGCVFFRASKYQAACIIQFENTMARQMGIVIFVDQQVTVAFKATELKRIVPSIVLHPVVVDITVRHFELVAVAELLDIGRTADPISFNGANQYILLQVSATEQSDVNDHDHRNERVAFNKKESC